MKFGLFLNAQFKAANFIGAREVASAQKTVMQARTIWRLLGPLPPLSEISDSLRAPAEEGRPPPTKTDAGLGHRCMGCQSSDAAFAHYDAQGNALLRVAGRTSRGRQGEKVGVRCSGPDVKLGVRYSEGGLLSLLRLPVARLPLLRDSPCCASPTLRYSQGGLPPLLRDRHPRRVAFLFCVWCWEPF